MLSNLWITEFKYRFPIIFIFILLSIESANSLPNLDAVPSLNGDNEFRREFDKVVISPC